MLVIDDADSAARISSYPQAEHGIDCMVEGDLEEAYDTLVDAELLDGSDGRALWSAARCSRPRTPELGSPSTTCSGSRRWAAQPARTLVMTRLHLRYTPDQIDEDLVLKREDPEVLRSTYITHDPQLESLYPICGEGFVTDAPGQCPEAVAGVDAGRAPHWMAKRRAAAAPRCPSACRERCSPSSALWHGAGGCRAQSGCSRGPLSLAGTGLRDPLLQAVSRRPGQRRLEAPHRWSRSHGRS